MTIQSRDANDKISDSKNDVYRVQFTRSDGGGSQQLAATAVYESAGLYKTELTPTIAGMYTVTVKFENAYTAADPTFPK